MFRAESLLWVNSMHADEHTIGWMRGCVVRPMHDVLHDASCALHLLCQLWLIQPHVTGWLCLIEALLGMAVGSYL